MIIKHKFLRRKYAYFYNCSETSEIKTDTNGYRLLGNWHINILNNEYTSFLYCVEQNLNYYFYVLCYYSNNNSIDIPFNSMQQVIDFIKAQELCPKLKLI